MGSEMCIRDRVGVESTLGALEVEHGDVDVGDGDAVDARGGRARGEGRAHGARDATRRRAEVCGRSEHGRLVYILHSRSRRRGALGRFTADSRRRRRARGRARRVWWRPRRDAAREG